MLRNLIRVNSLESLPTLLDKKKTGLPIKINVDRINVGSIINAKGDIEISIITSITLWHLYKI
jgi:hypothetical protein